MDVAMGGPISAIKRYILLHKFIYLYHCLEQALRMLLDNAYHSAIILKMADLDNIILLQLGLLN